MEDAAVDVSEMLFRAVPRDLEERAQAGLGFFEQRLVEYVKLANEMGAALPGRGQSPLVPAQTAGVRDAEWGARGLRRQLNLGDGPLGNLWRSVEEHLLIWRLPLGADLRTAPSGLFCNHPQAGLCVVVNSSLDPSRQLFALAHELAHAFLHCQSTDVVICMSGKIARERFADLFAGELLVPTDELHRAAGPFGALPERSVVADLQNHFGVDLATLRVRLLQEGLISRTDYDALAEPPAARRASTSSPTGSSPVRHEGFGTYECQPLESQPAQVLRLVRTALKRSVITRSGAMRVLGTSSEEINRLVVRPRPPAQKVLGANGPVAGRKRDNGAHHHDARDITPLKPLPPGEDAEPPVPEKIPKRRRRAYRPEFKADLVQVVLPVQQSDSVVAQERELDE